MRPQVLLHGPDSKVEGEAPVSVETLLAAPQNRFHHGSIVPFRIAGERSEGEVGNRSGAPLGRGVYSVPRLLI